MANRLDIIRRALEESLIRHSPEVRGQLALDQMALDVYRALAGGGGAPGHTTLDPEGAGLTPPELTSENDG